MPLRTTDCRLLFGEEHAREIFAICASLRRTAEGDGHGSFVSAVLRTGLTQVLHHRLRSAGAILQAALKYVRRFGCTTRELRKLVAWLRELGVEHVAIAYASHCTSLGRCETFSNRNLFDNFTPLAFLGGSGPGSS